MRIFMVAVFLLLISQTAHADGRPNNISWPGWEVSSSENWNLEAGPAPKFPLRFPITNLFDGDASTTWVHHDVRPQSDARQGPLYTEENPRYLQISSEKARWMSGIAIMNGYNRRPDLFRRNDRIIEVALEINHKFVKRARLSDQMGWHRISFPRLQVNNLKIRFVGIRKGDGPDNDICVSELALLDGTRKIELNMTPAVLYRLSYCCGGEGYVITRSGQRLAEGGFGEGLELEWSPSGRRLAGINSKTLWVVDMKRARVVYQSPREKSWEKLIWKNENLLQYGHFNYGKDKITASKLLNIS